MQIEGRRRRAGSRGGCLPAGLRSSRFTNRMEGRATVTERPAACAPDNGWRPHRANSHAQSGEGLIAMTTTIISTTVTHAVTLGSSAYAAQLTISSSGAVFPTVSDHTLRGRFGVIGFVAGEALMNYGAISGGARPQRRHRVNVVGRRHDRQFWHHFRRRGRLPGARRHWCRSAGGVLANNGAISVAPVAAPRRRRGLGRRPGGWRGWRDQQGGHYWRRRLR